MAKYEKTIYVSQTLLNMVNKHLTVEPTCREECLGEDNTISVTADFGNGIEMDIKCCSVQYEEGESNLAWTEAVLFRSGSEVCCSEPSDEFEGEWELEYKGDKYVVHVEAEN
jgi:hypothetical protein